MRKIIVFNMVSVDGYFAGVDGNINWHNVDREFNEFAIKHTREFGALIFGRVTYDLMAGYWPSEGALKGDPVVAGIMNGADKIVFSKTLNKAEWNNTRVMGNIEKSEIEKLKQQTGKPMAIFGSGQIVQEFAKLGLIDEYRLMLNPVVLGAGKPLFKQPLKLKLLKSREFKNGNVLLYYRPI
jgi:dihydrofolate reductase